MKFFSEFEHKWLSGIEFSIPDWNYFDFLEIMPDIIISNNGLEKFHQMLKCHINTTVTSMFRLYDLLAKEEAINKEIYESKEKVKDPFIWPITSCLK